MVQDQYPCGRVVLIEQEPRHHLVIANEFIRAFAVEIPPHDRTLCHRHEHDYLMYVAGDAEIVSAPQAGPPKRLTYYDGDCELSTSRIVHVVENAADAKFRNLLVELLPALGDSSRGPAPRLALGNVKVGKRFSDERVSAFLLQLENESGAEVTGPAAVASPYDDPIELTQPQGVPRELQQFTDLAWIGPGARGMLSNRTRHRARAVVIAVGRL